MIHSLSGLMKKPFASGHRRNKINAVDRDLAITTALMVKLVFSMPLRALQGFIDSVFHWLTSLQSVHIIVVLVEELSKSRFHLNQKLAVQYSIYPLVRRVSRFMAKVNGRSRSIVLTGSVESGENCI